MKMLTAILNTEYSIKKQAENSRMIIERYWEHLTPNERRGHIKRVKEYLKTAAN